MNPRLIKTSIVLLPIIILGVVLMAAYGSSAPAVSSAGSVYGNHGNDDVLRVFVYNIQHGRGMDGEVNIKRIAEVIQEKDPHIVALNEVDVGVERSGNIDIMAQLGEYLDMEPVFGKNITHQGGEFGNGILTRLPLISFQNLHLEMLEEGEQRGLLQTELEFNSIRFVFMTTHLDHRSESNRIAGVEQIIETIQHYHGLPIIMTGDFNAIPGSDVHNRMKDYFIDVWEEKGSGPGYTIPVPASESDRRIDYIFFTNNLSEESEEGEPCLRPVHMEVINSTASDHLPIYVEFELVE